MADGYLPFQNPTSTDAKLDTESLTVGANTVHRERIQIAGATDTAIAPVSATTGLYVDVRASALPSGAATSAKQDTEITSLQLIDDIVRSEDEASADGHKGAVVLVKRNDTPANTSGTDGDYEPLQVSAGLLWARVRDIQTPNGDSVLDDTTDTVKVSINAIGTTDALNISLKDGSGSHKATVRNYTDSHPVAVALTDSNGDQIDTLPISVATIPSHAVTNAGTFAVQESGAALTSLQLIDDTIYASGDALSKTLGIAAQFDDVTPGAMTENKMGPVRMSSRRELYTTIRDAAGNERGLNVDANGGIPITLEAAQTLATVTTVGTVTTITNVVHVDDNSGSLTVDNGGTFVVQENGAALTSLQLIDDTVYTDDTSTHSTGSSKGLLFMAAATPTDAAVNANDIGAVAMTTDRKLHVSVQDALPAGTNAIGKLAANSGVDIGDVDVTTVGTITPGTAATSLGKAEDAAHSSGDVGVMSLAVRKNTAASTSDTDGDYQPLITNTTGHLWVDASGQTLTVGSHAVTNAGTFAVQVDGNALTSLQLIDDPVIQDDTAFTPATSKVMMAGFEADESSTDSVDEGDAGAARMTLDRKQIVTLQPHTAGGLTTAMFSGSDGSSILVATAQVVKSTAGQLYGYYAYNPEAAVTFVHFYNTAAASVTVGTTNPLFTIAIPATSAANLSIPQGITFSNAGWSVAATTTAGGNTAPATGVSLVVWYM